MFDFRFRSLGSDEGLPTFGFLFPRGFLLLLAVGADVREDSPVAGVAALRAKVLVIHRQIMVFLRDFGLRWGAAHFAAEFTVRC